MSAIDTMVVLLSSVIPKGKIYPDVVPDAVQLPFLRYTESVEPNITHDGDAGDSTTTVISVCAATKAEARRLADEICGVLNMRNENGYMFYYQSGNYELFDQEKISSFDLTFKILK